MNTTTLNMTTLDGGVIIKKGEGGGATPVPPSGGGDSGSSTLEYLDLSGVQGYMKNAILYYSVLAKIQGDSVAYGVQIQPSGFLLAASGMTSLVTAVAIDLVIPITKYASEESGVEKQELTTLDADSGFMEMLDAIPRITKEEFYTLD